MSRLWIGVALLLGLLLGGLVLNRYVVPFHETLARELNAAAELAAQGFEPQARQLAAAAADRWQARKNAIAAITGREPVEALEALFRELSFLPADRSAELACLCSRLCQALRALAQTQQLNWWGLF